MNASKIRKNLKNDQTLTTKVSERAAALDTAKKPTAKELRAAREAALAKAQIETRYRFGKTLLGGALNAAQIEKANWGPGTVVLAEVRYNRETKKETKIIRVWPAGHAHDPEVRSEGRDWWQALFGNPVLADIVYKRAGQFTALDIAKKFIGTTVQNAGPERVQPEPKKEQGTMNATTTETTKTSKTPKASKTPAPAATPEEAAIIEKAVAKSAAAKKDQKPVAKKTVTPSPLAIEKAQQAEIAKRKEARLARPAETRPCQIGSRSFALTAAQLASIEEFEARAGSKTPITADKLTDRLAGQGLPLDTIQAILSELRKPTAKLAEQASQNLATEEPVSAAAIATQAKKAARPAKEKKAKEPAPVAQDGPAKASKGKTPKASKKPAPAADPLFGDDEEGKRAAKRAAHAEYIRKMGRERARGLLEPTLEAARAFFKATGNHSAFSKRLHAHDLFVNQPLNEEGRIETSALKRLRPEIQATLRVSNRIKLGLE